MANAVLKDMATTSFNKKTLGLEVGEPAVTPPSSDTQTSFLKKPKLAGAKSRKRDIPEGLWTKCEKCGNMIYDKELDANLKVCVKCHFHFPITARERINSLVETCSFEENDASMESVDVLQFTGVVSYTSKLKEHTSKTNLKEAVITGIGRIGKHRVALGVM